MQTEPTRRRTTRGFSAGVELCTRRSQKDASRARRRHRGCTATAELSLTADCAALHQRRCRVPSATAQPTAQLDSRLSNPDPESAVGYRFSSTRPSRPASAAFLILSFSLPLVRPLSSQRRAYALFFLLQVAGFRSRRPARVLKLAEAALRVRPPPRLLANCHAFCTNIEKRIHFSYSYVF